MINRNLKLIMAMLVLAVFAIGAVSAADDIATDIEEPTEDIAIDDIAVDDDSVDDTVEIYSNNLDDGECLNNNLDNENNLKNNYYSFCSTSYSFDDVDGWDTTGQVSISDSGYNGSCVDLYSRSSAISMDVDWSSIEKFEFWYKVSNTNYQLTCSVGENTILPTSYDQWTHFEYNTSEIYGIQTLKFLWSGRNQHAYIDSLNLIYKPTNLTYSFDDVDGWSTGGTVSISDSGYNGSCVDLYSRSSAISMDVDWSSIEKFEFWYKVSNTNYQLTCSVGENTILPTSYDQWTHFEYNTSEIYGIQTLKFLWSGRNQHAYIDSLVFTFNYNKKIIKELIPTKISAILNESKVIISLKDSEDNPISNVSIEYTINNGNIITNITDEEGQIVIGNILTDTIIFVSFAENDEYNASNITVKILSTKFSINSTDSSVIISLKDSENNPISGAKINYCINNNDLMSVITNNQGQVIVRNVIGNVTIFASYSGNDKRYLKTNGTENCYVNHFEGNPFTNPYFDEGIDESGNVYGWNITYGAAQGGSGIGGGVITGNDKNLMFSSNYYGYTISQYLNFDCIDKIFFKYFATTSAGTNYGKYDNLTIMIDGTSVESTHISRDDGWHEVIINVTNFNGYNLFKLSMSKLSGTGGTPSSIYFDDFKVEYNNKIISDFSYDYSLVNDNISVKFTNNIIGNITSILWNFGDGTNSSELNPIHIFKPGNYNVTLTVSNDNSNAIYSQVLSLDYPNINGEMYATVQDAINNATDGATIEIPNDITEDLNINQNLTLNFNGNNLNGNINVNNGANVTVTNISDVSSVSTDDSSKLTITDSNINSNLELKSGNIDVNGVNFNESILTITSANATLVNVNVANGGVVVNGGKSKITNSNLTGSNVAISQTAGELEIINNIITGNVKGIEITGGNATITFNAIYNNTDAFNATGATVTSTNNWYGTNTVTGIEQYLRLVLKVDTAKMYSGDEYDIGVDLTTDNNEASTIDAGALNDLTLQFTTTNGEVTPVTIHNGKGELKFKAGSLTDEVKLTLFGEEYELEDASIVEKPLQTNITITSTEKGVITIVLKDSNGKNISNAIITYKINTENEVNKTTDANGIVSVPNLKGAISITVNYAGNDTYFPSNKENNFVFAYDTSISTTVAGNSIIITLKDDENKAIPNANVTYKINNAETTTATDINGTVTIPNLKGTIALTVTYKESELYSASNKTDNFVFPYTTTITAPSVSATYNVVKNLVITLKDENGKAVVGRTVSVKVGSISKNLVTNNNGQVSLNIAGLVPKTYTATISFEGDSLYTKSSLNTVKVVVAKATPKITAKKATFKAKTKTKKYSITVKNNKGKAMSKVKVTLKVGKKTYKATTNSKGKATFKITKLTKKGKYTGTIKFAGNKYFKSVSKKVKLTVKK